MNANEMNKHYNNTAKMHLQTNDPIQEKDGEARSHREKEGERWREGGREKGKEMERDN